MEVVQLLFRDCGGFSKAMSGDVNVGVDFLGPVESVEPVAGPCRPHRRENAIQKDLAQEKYLLTRQIDTQIAAGMRAPQEQDWKILVSHPDRFFIGDEANVGGWLPSIRRFFENRLRSGMDVIGDSLRQHRIAATHGPDWVFRKRSLVKPKIDP